MKGLIKVIIGVVLMVIGILYFLDRSDQQKKRSEAYQVRIDSISNTVKLSIESRVKYYNAIDDWEKEFVNHGVSIFTYELEELWVNKRPILLLGNIKDISNNNDSTYLVLFERSIIFNETIIYEKLQFLLECDRLRIDTLIENHRIIIEDEGLLRGGVAVIANISKIVSEREYDKETTILGCKTGVGTCLDIIYTGDVRF